MAVNFNHCNSISSVGLELGNKTIDVRFLISPTSHSNLGLNHVTDHGCGLLNSNLGVGQLGLISHRVTELKKTCVSLNRVRVHSVIDYVPVQNQPAFPLSEVTAVTEVVKTTRFLTSTSTVERMFASCSRVRNQAIFPIDGVCIQAQPAVRNQSNQMMNFLRSENPSMNQEALNILNHNNTSGNVKRETVFDPTSAYHYEHPSYNQGLSFDQRDVVLQNLDYLNWSNYYNMNQERDLNYINHVRVPSSIQERDPSPNRSQPSFHSSLEEVSDENDEYDYPLRYDGRTHSLLGYPEGVYGCPKCLATFYKSQTFAAHIQSHYKQESKEERRRRMAAKYRQRNLRLLRSSHGLTAVPKSSKGITKRYTARRKNDIAVKIGNIKEVHPELGLNTPGVAKKGPFLGVMIKESPIRNGVIKSYL
ncbi:hypothetical protein REPUB_Repub05bG0098400 [Reevesia pubescens]